jgi:hypothetical protein
MSSRLILLAAALAVVSLPGCGDDEVKNTLDDLPYGAWLKIEPEGKVCSNGSQYKFFVNLSRGSDDVVIIMEPGGACWDYESCSGATGIRGAANPNGVPDDHMETMVNMSPLLRRTEVYGVYSPVADYNIVFVPYCTGDIHSGNRVMEYTNPEDSNDVLTFHHKDAENVRAVADWVSERFSGQIDTLFVTGCSAGGVGSLANYYFIRNAFTRVGRGVMLDDAGPVFPNSPWSKPLHTKVRESWDVDSVLDLLPEEHADRIKDDFGSINELLAEEFPEDRLSNVFFRLDYNFSLYSYERFYDGPDDLLDPGTVFGDDYRSQIYHMWWDDTQELLALSDQHDNLGYYIPFYRGLNDSHCATIIGWLGTEMDVDGEPMDLYDYMDELLHGEGPVPSYVEPGPEGQYGHLAPPDPWPLP